jgi:flagellar basal-body rod protein FlgC
LSEFRKGKLRLRFYDEDMSPTLSIAASGMSAATRRLEVSARNIANAYSAGPLPSPDVALIAIHPPAYEAQRVEQVETADGGTRAFVREASPGTVTAYDPNAPYADANGMVAMPNVDLANEAVEHITAQLSFAMNAYVARTSAHMMKSLIDIKA